MSMLHGYVSYVRIITLLRLQMVLSLLAGLFLVILGWFHHSILIPILACWDNIFFTLCNGVSLCFQLLILYQQRAKCWQDFGILFLSLSLFFPTTGFLCVALAVLELTL